MYSLLSSGGKKSHLFSSDAQSNKVWSVVCFEFSIFKLPPPAPLSPNGSPVFTMTQTLKAHLLIFKHQCTFANLRSSWWNCFAVDAFCTFPQVPVTGGGQGKQGRDTASVAGCHSGFRGSSSTQLLMPCYPPAIHHSSLRVRYALPSNPPHHPLLPAFLTFPCGSLLLIAVRTALMYTNTHPPRMCMYS